MYFLKLVLHSDDYFLTLITLKFNFAAHASGFEEL